MTYLHDRKEVSQYIHRKETRSYFSNGADYCDHDHKFIFSIPIIRIIHIIRINHITLFANLRRIHDHNIKRINMWKMLQSCNG